MKDYAKPTTSELLETKTVDNTEVNDKTNSKFCSIAAIVSVALYVTATILFLSKL